MAYFPPAYASLPLDDVVICELYSER
jgi:hypothetical protein